MTIIRILVAFAIISAGSKPGVGQSTSEPTPSPVAVSAGPMPRVQGLDGSTRDLTRDDRALVVVLIFVRTDCPISNRYAPVIRRLVEQFQPQGVSFYLVFVDRDETSETMQTHLKEFGYPCPGLFDPDHILVKYTGATVSPEAVVLDRTRHQTYRGRIDDQYVDFGKRRATPTRQDLHDAIEATLNHRNVDVPVTKAIGCYIGDLD